MINIKIEKITVKDTKIEVKTTELGVFIGYIIKSIDYNQKINYIVDFSIIDFYKAVPPENEKLIFNIKNRFIKDVMNDSTVSKILNELNK